MCILRNLCPHLVVIHPARILITLHHFRNLCSHLVIYLTCTPITLRRLLTHSSYLVARILISKKHQTLENVSVAWLLPLIPCMQLVLFHTKAEAILGGRGLARILTLLIRLLLLHVVALPQPPEEIGLRLR